MAKKDIQPKIIVISGGSTGLGKEIVELIEKNGDIAVNLSRSNPNNLENHIACDISCPNSINAAADIIKEKFGTVDILINNAGLGISGATELLDDIEIERVMDVDYLGALRLSRAVLPLMHPKSKIVNISSACALFALPYRGVYCSAKAAVNMLSYSMRMELSRYGIKVVCICPGEIKTEFTKNRIKFSQTNEKYGDSPQLSAESIDKNDDKRMSAKKAAKKIYRITMRKNGTMYIVGGKYKLFAFFQRILPLGMFNGIINKLFNKK